MSDQNLPETTNTEELTEANLETVAGGIGIDIIDLVNDTVEWVGDCLRPR